MCNNVMDQLKEPLWPISEMAADLARMTENEDNPLLWYSRCPRGRHQCFACRTWLTATEQCKYCPPCENCRGPMTLVALDDDTEDDETPEEMFACMRCEESGEDEDDEDSTTH